MSNKSSETNEIKLAMLEHGGRRGDISMIGHWICLARSLSGVGLVLSCGHCLHHCSKSRSRGRVRRPWEGAEGEGIQEGELSPPLLLTKGILYSLLDSSKVTWLQLCPTLPLPAFYQEAWSLHDQARD